MEIEEKARILAKGCSALLKGKKPGAESSTDLGCSKNKKCLIFWLRLLTIIKVLIFMSNAKM